MASPASPILASSPAASIERATVSRLIPEDAAGIAAAAEALRAGGVIVMPTDTLYGIGADATNEAAVAHVFEVKGRGDDKPLLVLAPDLATVERDVTLSSTARILADRFWPGPLTLIANRRPDARLARGLNPAGSSIGLRVPNRVETLSLLRSLGRPITAPSANRTGVAPARTASEALHTLGALVDLVLDGGESREVQPSTIIDCTGMRPRLVREGAIARAAIMSAIGELG